MRVGLDDRVRLHHLELAEQFVREEAVKVLKWQVDRSLFVLRLDGAQAATAVLLRILDVANVDRGSVGDVSRSLVNRLLVGDELRLVDGLGLAGAPTEQIR